MDAQTQIREEAVAFDHFARITDDVLLLIVSRLESLKHMCQCSLVSKRFASTIYKIQAVSLTLPSTEIPSDARADDINALFPELAGFTSEEAIRFIQSSSIHEMKFLPFLGNFRRLKSISMEFACANCLCSSSLFKMRVRFSKRGGGVVEKYVSIVADYVRKVTERGYDDGRVYGPRRNDAIADTFLPFGCCTNWLLALCLLIKCQPSLERIAITNDKKQGKLVLEDKQLVAWRNSFVPGGLLHDFRPYAYTDGWVSALRIPSGYLLKGVNVMVSRWDPEPSTVEDDDDAMTWEYPGEKRLLDDAVGEYLRRYPDAFMEAQFAD